MYNTLIIATTSYAGMGPYVSSIVNNFAAEDPVYFMFHDYEDEFFKKNIKKELKGKSRFSIRANTHWNKLLDLLCSKPSKEYKQQLLTFCEEYDIQIVHWINGPGNRYINRFLTENGIKVLSTIHDLHPHESKAAPHKMLRFHILNKRNYLATEEANYLVTNSKVQFDELRQLYPKRHVYFHEFPSLVTGNILNGKIKPKELINQEKPYILFFGRIEEYKGIPLLYKAYTESPDISDRFDLIIAGSGTFTLKQGDNSVNVKYLNRYIKDEEIKYLYEHAACVVYPYISATQSGVLSLAYYFGTPVLASDVDFFRGIIQPSGAGQLFKSRNIDDLKIQLSYILNNDTKKITACEKEYYRKFYDGKAIRQQLLEIYKNMAGDKI